MRRPDPGPVRTCVGCRRRKRAEDLVRITRDGGAVAVDGPSRGRGAWLCRADSTGDVVDGGCLERALAGKGFERAWRGAVGDAERRSLGELAGDGAMNGGHAEGGESGPGEGLTTGKG